MRNFLMFVFVVLGAWPVMGAEVHVRPMGDDAAAGTRARPFRTLTRAARALRPGDTCVLGSGVYRETVKLASGGAEGKPIRFVAAAGQKVMLSGTEVITRPWRRHEGRIYKTSVQRPVRQLFVDGRMMIEARWPNATFAQLLDREHWAHARKGSRYGKIVDPALARTGADWTGALATLNVAHQFFTWTRTVEKHSPGSDTFTYKRDLKGITHHAAKTRPWEDDRYILSGTLAALDTPGEWFWDRGSRTLYLWAPGGQDPSSRSVEHKVRDYVLAAHGADWVELRGLDLFGATVQFNKCNHVTVEDCRLRFPVYDRQIGRRASKPKPSAQTILTGSHNTVRRCLIAYSSHSGLVVTGTHLTIEENVIHDVCWNGSLDYAALKVYGPAGGKRDYSRDPAPTDGRCMIRRNTLFRAGNAVLCFGGQGGYVVEYNHVYDGGRLCKDVALVYTQLPCISGSVIRYNWVHGCRTEGRHYGGLAGGLGIRGDDQTRGLTVHHNVVWDCGRDGIIVKGNRNRVCNNTVLQIGSKRRAGNYVNLHTTAEPKKPWRPQYPLLKKQNTHSLVHNNVALTVTGHNRGMPLPKGKNVSHNFQGKTPSLVDPAKRDFRPQPGSRLVDAGKIVPGITDGYKGKAPDIGAYEYGARPWRPGATWWEAQNPRRDPKKD